MTDLTPHAPHAPEPTVLGTNRRRCVRPGCGRRPATTLRFDYSARILTVDPLAPRGVPGEYDLCAEHAARTTPPSGWTMRDRAPTPPPASEPTPPVGPARAHSADRLAAALSAVPRAVSEDAPDAAPVQAHRRVDLVEVEVEVEAAVVTDPEQRRARLDALLRPSVTGAATGSAGHPSSSTPSSTPASTPAAPRTGGDPSPSRAPLRPAPQSLRLAPDPTTTVWCADLLATPASAPLPAPAPVSAAPSVSTPDPHPLLG